VNFDHYCQGVAKNFIQSVMVVDDQADLKDRIAPEPVPTVAVPKLRSLSPARVDPSGQEPAGSEAEREEISHGLDGMQLTRSFAKLGVACSIYRPEQIDGTEEIDDTVRVARHADVVVLDWRLGSDANKAKEIVIKILEQDARENGRHRLIAIYTGEVGLDRLRTDLAAKLAESGIEVDSTGTSGPVALKRRSLRIVFINKNHAGVPINEPGVGESDLPGRLVEEFAEMSRGIMPSVALGSITAIRNSTHHVLAKFHAGLDGALATHRALIENPEDAEIYAADLVAEELRTILEVMRVGAANAGMEVFESWVAYLSETGHRFRVSAEATDALQPATAIKLLRTGTPGHEEVRNTLKPPPGKDKFTAATPHLFHADAATAEKVNLEFARLDALKREAYGTSVIPAEWEPTLTLGTIVMDASQPDRLYACIQPVCDAVRVPEMRRFPMVPLRVVEGAKPFSFVLKLKDGKHLCVEPDHHPYNIEHFVFDIDAGSKTVRGHRDDSARYLFKASDNQIFEWLADLKGFLALRLIQRSAGQVDRVGLDQYEWLRSKGGKGNA
jgi:hypothetical protein